MLPILIVHGVGPSVIALEITLRDAGFVTARVETGREGLLKNQAESHLAALVAEQLADMSGLDG